MQLLLASAAVEADIFGHVVGVMGRDTLEVRDNQRPKPVSLNGIDCPKKGQAYGNNAKHAASQLAFGNEVTIQTYGSDKYTRTLADVRLLHLN
jgi:micrococcal nuclease